MSIRVEVETAKVVVPTMLPLVALMVVVPTARPVTNPVGLIDATIRSLDAQLKIGCGFKATLFWSSPVACIWKVLPTVTVALIGETFIFDKVKF